MTTATPNRSELIKEALKKLHGLIKLKWEFRYRVSRLKYKLFWGKDSRHFYLFSSRKLDKVPYIYATESSKRIFNPGEVGHVNAWEYYFEQPGGVSLEDALSCKEYILGRDTVQHNMPSWTTKLFYNHDNELDYWRNICKKYIKFKPTVLDMLARKQAEFSDKRVLGVSIRGTDYVTLKPYGHPVQPTPEQVIAKCQEAMQT